MLATMTLSKTSLDPLHVEPSRDLKGFKIVTFFICCSKYRNAKLISCWDQGSKVNPNGGLYTRPTFNLLPQWQQSGGL
jgi:hypothetical protein